MPSSFLFNYKRNPSKSWHSIYCMYILHTLLYYVCVYILYRLEMLYEDVFRIKQQSQSNVLEK